MNDPKDHGDDRRAQRGSRCVGVSADLVAFDLTAFDLVAFDRDELGAADAAAVRTHLASCASCAAELRRVRRTFELVARATDVVPSATASARLRRALDEAMAEAPAGAPVLSLWGRARARYEESARFRRFTLASIGLHAAAALLLAVVLARSGGAPERPAVLRIQPEEVVSLPDERTGGVAERTASLAPFDAATADGAVAQGAPNAVFPNAVFPNATTAARWGAISTSAGRRAALRVALGAGDDQAAERAEVAIDRGLSWLAAQRGSDGSLGAPAERLAATSAAVLAFAGQGRTTFDDAGLALSVAWLERQSSSEAAVEAIEDEALALRALTAQLVADYAHIGRAERERRSSSVASLTARLESAAARRASAPVGAPVGARGGLGASASVSVVAALADVRTAGFRDTAASLSSLVRRLDYMRSPDGHVTGHGQEDGVSLTAALAEVALDAGARPLSDPLIASLSSRIGTLAASSTLDGARGAGALAAVGRPVREPIRAVLADQRPDGSWSPAHRAVPPVSALVETAYGVVAVTRAYRR